MFQIMLFIISSQRSALLEFSVKSLPKLVCYDSFNKDVFFFSFRKHSLRHIVPTVCSEIMNKFGLFIVRFSDHSQINWFNMALTAQHSTAQQASHLNPSILWNEHTWKWRGANATANGLILWPLSTGRRMVTPAPCYRQKKQTHLARATITR